LDLGALEKLKNIRFLALANDIVRGMDGAMVRISFDEVGSLES
jgi:hypothetical protein